MQLKHSVGRAASKALTLVLPFITLLASVDAFAQGAAVGEVVLASGVVTAQRQGGEARMLGKGTPLYEGDVLSTGRKGFGVVEFKDGTRMTLRPDTVFRVDQYVTGGAEENALLHLFKGGLRAITGVISKRNPNGYRIETATNTIGIRGTDFDARLCVDDCAAEEKELQSPAAAAALQLLRVALAGATASDVPLHAGLLESDASADAGQNPIQLAQAAPVSLPPGLYVHLREGLIELIQDGKVLAQMRPGEFFRAAGVQVVNLERALLFLERDPYLRLNPLSPDVQRRLDLNRGAPPGDNDCEVR